jgi:alpha-glucosidase
LVVVCVAFGGWGVVWGAVGSEKVVSPEGKVEVVAGVKVIGGVEGCLYWSVSYEGKVLIADSRLGLELKGAPALMEGFRVEGVERVSEDNTWEPVYGERSEIRDHYNGMAVKVADALGRRMALEFRAYDEGAAFRYVVGKQEGLGEFTISAEHTEFCFTGAHDAWCVYSAQGVYSKKKLGAIGSNCERPLTIEIEGGPAVSIAEAGLVDYARMRLRDSKGGPYAVESVLAGEAVVKTPFVSPWRVVMIADNVGGLLEHDYIILNLNEPCRIADTSWIKPGKVIREVSLTTEGGKACVDFAVERGLQYVEFDAGWYGPEGSDDSDATTVTLDPKRSKGPLDLQEVIRYGESKGIGILVYVNRKALEKQLDEILPLYRKWGIKGVKYGFVQVGDQKWTGWLHEAIRKAAENELMVDVHDEYRPTGFERTYPNFMTMEGIGGNETMPTPEHNLVLPFTRYLCGAGDYTICWHDGRIKTTRAHQMALAAAYYSPWQFVFWYDRPSQFAGQGQQKELEFFKYVPTVWDETKVLEGKVGEYATVARRSGRDWFVGSINAVQRRRVEIRLGFLEKRKKYHAQIYSDGAPDGSDGKAVKVQSMSVDRDSKIEVEVAANGGAAMRIVHVDIIR